MSVATRRAIYGKLSGDTTLTNMLGAAAPGFNKGIYYQQAPKGATMPFVIFSRQAGTPSYALTAKTFDNEIWLVKGVDKSPDTDVVDNIASRINALLTDGTLSISGATQSYLRRESDVDYPESDEGVTYHHAGSNFRLVTQ